MKNSKYIYYVSIICLLLLALSLTAFAKPCTAEQAGTFSQNSISLTPNKLLTSNQSLNISTTGIHSTEQSSDTSEISIVSTTATKSENETSVADEVYLGRYKLTAYCPCSECSGSWGKQTSTGATATEGRTIGVDPNIIEYGTEVYIEGVGVRVAEDTGGAVNNKHIDIFMDSHSDCMKFGVKYADVYLIREK